MFGQLATIVIYFFVVQWCIFMPVGIVVDIYVYLNAYQHLCDFGGRILIVSMKSKGIWVHAPGVVDETTLCHETKIIAIDETTLCHSSSENINP